MSAVVGIDLGYQNSVIAAAGRGGVDVILNGNSNRQNPSMVGFSENRKMGELASAGATSNFRNTVQGLKRLVGLTWTDPRAHAEMARWPAVQFAPMEHDNNEQSIGVKVVLGGTDKILPIEMVTGMMVKHLGEIAASKALSNSNETDVAKLFPHDWVIAIPCYYTDAQRRALLAGCEMVGVQGVLRLMHDPTATALAYGIFKDVKKVFTADKPTHVMFLDMGACSFSCSIVSFEPGKLIVKSVLCDMNLGGRDFDDVIANYVATQFVEKYKAKLSSSDPMAKPKSRNKLLSAAEKAKKTLSPQGVKEARINVETLMDDLDFGLTLKASDYEKLCQPLLDKLAAPIHDALAETKLAISDLDSVELVGGSTRIGCVKRKLLEILKGVSTLSTTLNADECVARGAALQSAILSPRFKVLPYEIVEAQPFPIQLSWQDDAAAAGMEVDSGSGDATPTDAVVMFDRNLSFPVVRRVTLRRSGKFAVECKYDQSAIQYGLPPEVGKEIGVFTIAAPEGEENKVRVNVKEDIHGIIHMSSAQMVQEVEEDTTGDGDAKEDGAPEGEGGEKKKKIKKTNLDWSVTRPLDWSRDDINKYYEEEVAMANADRVVQETADMRNELESYIYDMRDKISSDSQLGQFGTESEKSAFLAKNEQMENWLYEDGFEATKKVYAEKLAELKKVGVPIEARHFEAEARPAAVAQLQANLEKYQKWVNESQGNDNYAHITDEERQKVHNKCDETSSWVYDMLDKQGNLAAYQDPVLKIADVNSHNTELTNVCVPIMNKRAPPKPKEEKKPDEAAPPQSENGEAEPMDTEKANGTDEPAPMEQD